MPPTRPLGSASDDHLDALSGTRISTNHSSPSPAAAGQLRAKVRDT